MFVSIARVVEQFKHAWTQEISDEAIESTMRESGRRWRDRKLNPVTTVQLLFLQMLHGNAACNFLRRLSRRPFTGAAYCEARGKLPLEALQMLSTRGAYKRGHINGAYKRDRSEWHHIKAATATSSDLYGD